MLETKLIPAKHSDSKRLLIVLHGLGDSMEGYAWMPQTLQLPWLNYLLVNAPDRYFQGFSWYDYAGDAATGVRRSRQLLNELIDAQVAQGIPARQILLCGFSQGCLMTLETGLRYPHRLAGLIGLSGYVLSPPELITELSPVAREQRILVTHGTEDPLIPFEGVRRQVEELTNAGLNITWREFHKSHTIIEEEIWAVRDFIESAYT